MGDETETQTPAPTPPKSTPVINPVYAQALQRINQNIETLDGRIHAIEEALGKLAKAVELSTKKNDIMGLVAKFTPMMDGVQEADELQTKILWNIWIRIRHMPIQAPPKGDTTQRPKVSGEKVSETVKKTIGENASG